MLFLLNINNVNIFITVTIFIIYNSIQIIDSNKFKY